MIRLSVTHLDGYRYWRDNEDVPLNVLLARLRGDEPPTQAMLAGRAFHSFLEHATIGDVHVATVDGFEFDFALDQEIELPAVRELKAECLMETPSGPVTLVGKVDGLHGTTVRDYKLTEQFNAEKYADSYQWRCYLSMFESQTFVYDVFQARYDGPRIVIYDYHRMSFSAYPGMRADVQREVSALAEIVATHLPEKVAA